MDLTSQNVQNSSGTTRKTACDFFFYNNKVKKHPKARIKFERKTVSSALDP